MEDGPSHRIETFDSLLRDLVTWDLVARAGPKAKPWQLVAAAQARLDELVEPAGPIAADQLVYLDHLCASCHFRGRTRLHDGLYLCDDCTERRATGARAEKAPLAPAGRRGHWRWHRHAGDGGTSLAG